MTAFLSAASLNGQTRSNQTAREFTLHSSLLSEDRRILLRLPRLYDLDTTARYPVLYRFDGDNQLDRYDHTIDVLNSIDAVPDLIVVAIPNGRGLRNRDLTPASLHQDGNEQGLMGTGEMGRGDRFLDFIEKELIPHVEKNYRTTQERILAGHSRAALLVLQSLLSMPNLFQGRLMFSAPLMRDEQRMIADTRKFFKENAALKSFLYCNWGEAENEGMNKSYNAMKALLMSDAPKGLLWTIERARAANHQQTPIVAFPSSLYDYFAGRPKMGLIQENRTARVTSGAQVQPSR
ncbi:MAG: alpha/beta hydrolase [Acidobacteria bacterium]|nr:alpha/beta hydrolase [Acidobacteriota bacterium]